MGFKGSSKKKKKKISPARGQSSSELLQDFKLGLPHSSRLGGVLPCEDSECFDEEVPKFVLDVATVAVGSQVQISVGILGNGSKELFVDEPFLGNASAGKLDNGGKGASSIENQRATFYRLDDDKVWRLLGSGRTNIEFPGVLENSTLVVSNERNNTSLLTHCFRSDVVYSKHNDTTISWRDPEDDFVEALVFQEITYCSSVWDHINKVQNYISSGDENSSYVGSVNSNDVETSSDVSEYDDSDVIVNESVISGVEGSNFSPQISYVSSLAVSGNEGALGMASESHALGLASGISVLSSDAAPFPKATSDVAALSAIGNLSGIGVLWGNSLPFSRCDEGLTTFSPLNATQIHTGKVNQVSLLMGPTHMRLLPWFMVLQILALVPMCYYLKLMM